MLYTLVKKYAVFILLVAILIFLGYIAYRQMLWKQQAMLEADFAAKLFADNHYNKGKLIKLELVVKDKPEQSQDKPYRFDGPYVVLEWIGYNYPLCRFIKSPSVLVSEEFVKVYNEEMNEIVSDPNKHERWKLVEINYWKENVLSKRPTDPNNDNDN